MAVSGLGARVDTVRSQSGAEIQRAHGQNLNPESGIIVSPHRGDVAEICETKFSGQEHTQYLPTRTYSSEGTSPVKA